MIYQEQITGAVGWLGNTQIGRAHLGSWRWHVEIFHKVADLHAHSWRESRQLLAVHGADRVDVFYRVKAIWPAGIDPPYQAFLPPGSVLLPRAKPADFPTEGVLSGASAKKIFAQPDPWKRQWFSAIPSRESEGKI